MRTTKKYRLIKGSGGGAQEKTIGIEMTGRDVESAIFCGKVRHRAEQIFGKGASLNNIGTTYGVHFRYDDESKNRKMAKMLIKIVELEDELLKMYNPKKHIVVRCVHPYDDVTQDSNGLICTKCDTKLTD